MRYYTDWDCRLLPMMGDLIANPEDSLRSLLLLQEKFGLSHFCMMPVFDCDQDSVSAFLARREKSFAEISDRIPTNIHITLGSTVLVRKGLSTEMGLKKLLLPHSKFLPIRLPLDLQSNDTSVELNRLFYHSPYSLLFLCTDSYLDFYSIEDIERWMNLPNTAFQFRFSALENPNAIRLLKLLLAKNKPVFFGTAINSYGKACYYEFDHYVGLAKKYFNDYERDLLFFPKKQSYFT